MLTFSNNPKVAEQQMQAVIFYLTTFGYIDGDFDESERVFVSEYIEKLVAHRVKTGMPDADDNLRVELTEKFTKHFHEEFESIDLRIQELFTEAVSKDEDQATFVQSKLKLRCFEIFKSFDEGGQESLMETVDELLMADGVAHPAEVKFRAELSALLETDLEVELVEEGESPPVSVTETVKLVAQQHTHPYFDQFEHHYSGDHSTLMKQLDADRGLIQKTRQMFATQRAAGNGKLSGKQKVSDLAGEDQFLDGHVYVVPPKPGRTYDLTVLGDLHGCYSCLKSAVMQARFFEKVEAFQADPENNPDPKLIFLGDYIDRGMFSLNGVLRSVLKMASTAPDHVFLLRGNHEFYIEYEGQVYGGVIPAEAINTLKPHVSTDVFKNYIDFFEDMPNMLLFGETLFVHGGIAKDQLLKERYVDLSSLNDPDIRFQMMWSDPSSADVIPAALQEQSSRFPFGRLQAAAFLQKIGCHTIVRGHEKVNDGFARTYDDENIVLITLFSAGGRDNDDLPPRSGYRRVTPMAMTMKIKDGEVEISPWKIDYELYNNPDRNRFFQVAPSIEHIAT
ncbi:MAG: serine/threonine protein phosphatase [Deltaproteobacteria bacterium]|nr:serine/threonine protein phosphatase [Deltaproteobacteria bacterium]